jgi:hypothetical protein
MIFIFLRVIIKTQLKMIILNIVRFQGIFFKKSKKTTIFSIAIKILNFYIKIIV